MTIRARLPFLLLGLVTLAACDAKAKARPATRPTADECARAADHGAKLVETQLRGTVPFDDMTCVDAPATQLQCMRDARTSDDVLACARAALTDTITIRPPGATASAEQRAACTAANDNWLRVQLAAITAARADHITACLAADATALRCQLAATDPVAWLACSPPPSR